MTYDKKLLHFYVTDALRGYSDNTIFLNSQNPLVFSLNGIRYSAHISYVHDSGENRDNDDEARIQISREHLNIQRAYKEQGIIPVFLGFFQSGEVFTAWDPEQLFSMEFKDIGSVYARKSHFSLVKSQQAALYRFKATKLGRLVSTVSLPSDTLGFYLENHSLFHKVEEERDLLALVQRYSQIEPSASERTDIEVEINKTREKRTFSITRTAYVRNPKFMRDVMQAYNGQCCICGRQLGLVQAAHIIPHSHPESVDSVKNGLAMCVEHHKLYDDGLLLPNVNQTLHLNPERESFLKQTGRDRGLDDIRRLAQTRYSIPSDTALQPDPAYLSKGIQIRLA